MLTQRAEDRDEERVNESDSMLKAIFGAVGEFAALPEQKLMAIARAGRIAEAFYHSDSLRSARTTGAEFTMRSNPPRTRPELKIKR
jgi:hypothetical protein